MAEGTASGGASGDFPPDLCPPARPSPPVFTLLRKQLQTKKEPTKSASAEENLRHLADDAGGGEWRKARRQGVPREKFQPGNLAFPQISAPAVHPPPLETLQTKKEQTKSASAEEKIFATWPTMQLNARSPAARALRRAGAPALRRGAPATARIAVRRRRGSVRSDRRCQRRRGLGEHGRTL